VFQQGTYAPDSTYRWMGSIAMDQSGDIALGYSVSSGSINPGVRYTGRVPTDPPGTMQAEQTIIDGGGSQLINLNRWGDYSSMSIDPVDDCTFWYTTEYLKASGTFNWSTRIISFKFPNCGGTITPVHDVAVTSVTAPSPVVVNTAQAVGVTVQNLGTQAESFSVSLSDSQSAIITNSQSVTNLGAGSSQTLTFGWTPSVTGTHTLVATGTTVPSETNTANNTAQTTSTVNSVSAGPPTITSINPSSMKTGTSTTSFTITGTNFVGGATVTFLNGTGPAPTASSVTVTSGGAGITATVNVPSGGAPRNRLWDVKVVNPDGQIATLVGSFTVTP
jgi:CARDB